jgi:hypothetical protein
MHVQLDIGICGRYKQTLVHWYIGTTMHLVYLSKIVQWSVYVEPDIGVSRYNQTLVYVESSIKFWYMQDTLVRSFNQTIVYVGATRYFLCRCNQTIVYAGATRYWCMYVQPDIGVFRGFILRRCFEKIELISYERAKYVSSCHWRYSRKFPYRNIQSKFVYFTT